MAKTEAAKVVDTEEQPVVGNLISDDVLLRVGLVVGLALHTLESHRNKTYFLESKTVQLLLMILYHENCLSQEGYSRSWPLLLDGL